MIQAIKKINTIENFDLRNFEHLIGKGWYMIDGFRPSIIKFTGGKNDDFPEMENLKYPGENMAVKFFTYSQGLRSPEIGYSWKCIYVNDLIKDRNIIFPKKVADMYNELLGKYLTERNRFRYADIKECFPDNIQNKKI